MYELRMLLRTKEVVKELRKMVYGDRRGKVQVCAVELEYRRLVYPVQTVPYSILQTPLLKKELQN